MKIQSFLSPFLAGLVCCAALVQGSDRAANTVILNAEGVKNLGIETVAVSETDFEDTVFAIGRIEEVPSRHAVVSSRISGRVIELKAFKGEQVEKDQEIVRVESRQPGDPPPVISLKAPISGLIVESHVRLGEPVEPDGELADILDLSEVWAVARVPEHHAARLEPGKTRSYIHVSALGDIRLEGKLLRFGTEADRESGTLDAIFQVPNHDNRLRPGMRAEFSIVISQRSGVMAVPREAIQGDVSGRVVFVKDFELPNAFVKVPVKTGAQNDRYTEIISGLLPGDEVVTTGSYLLGYAGGGGISLKEALDAAHGHEHAEDGSELTARERAEKAAEKAAARGGGARDFGPMTLFLGIACGVLLVLLIVSLFVRRPGTGQSTA